MPLISAFGPTRQKEDCESGASLGYVSRFFPQIGKISVNKRPAEAAECLAQLFPISPRFSRLVSEPFVCSLRDGCEPGDKQVTCLPFTEVMAAKPLAQMCQTVTMPRKKGGKKGAGQGANVLGKRVECFGSKSVRGRERVYIRLLALAPHLPSLESPVLAF